jgi:hypothetical protein
MDFQEGFPGFNVSSWREDVVVSFNVVIIVILGYLDG